MDHILILMDAPAFADARGAIASARKHARHPEALSFGFTFQEEPQGDSLDALNALMTATWIPCAQADAWAEMERLWMGEDYVLMAHPAMRFSAGWDVKLLKALRACRPGQQTTCALTGCLPTPSDPLVEVCPVAADAFGPDGTLTLMHGMPMRHMTRPARGPFLHPHFCFAPAGFFRAVSKGDEPLFMRAFRADWELYTLHAPIIELQWSVPVPPVHIPADHDLITSFDNHFGVAFASQLLSPQARRGMMSTTISKPKRYPVKLQLSEWWAKVRYKCDHMLPRHEQKVSPRCVTLFMGESNDETLLWFRQLAELTNIPLTAYVPALLKRYILDFAPDAYDLLPQHIMEIPGMSIDDVAPLSKAAILAAARDRFLAPSHYIWIDPDCVRYPVYDKAFLQWEPVCADKIVMAMVNGQPDTTMFSVPQDRVHDLANDLLARTITILNQRGTLPTESELWNIVIRENPDWFLFINFPARGLLFTLVSAA